MLQEEQSDDIFIRQGVFAPSGTGSSHAKQTKYFEKAGSCFSTAYCTLSGCCGLSLSTQRRDGHYYSLHFVDEETTAQKG